MIPPRSTGRIGRPSLGLEEAEICAVLGLIVVAGRLARPTIVAYRAAGERVDENFISAVTMQWIQATQRRFDIEGFEFTREALLEATLGQRPKILGRIDFKVKFAHQLGHYGDYLGVECKRIASKRSALARYYIATGVGKFASGLYGAGHPAGVIVGFIVQPSVPNLPGDLSKRVCQAYPGSTAMQPFARNYRGVAVVEGIVPRTGAPPIRLIHALIPMHA